MVFFKYAMRLEVMKGTLGGFDVIFYFYFFGIFFFVAGTRAGVKPGLLG